MGRRARGPCAAALALGGGSEKPDILVPCGPRLPVAIAEAAGVPRRTRDVGVPRSNPLKVVYMSRSHGGTNNGGRRVVSEDAVLRSVTALLAERNRGEELVMFNPNHCGNITELFSWFSENVVADVGPHGGVMINHRCYCDRTSGFDMDIDVEDVVSLLRKQLGVVGTAPLRRNYLWPSKELGFKRTSYTKSGNME
ncbi:hypothetical protein B0H13DRAFT_1873076 [Mycena leptocephala]|nr:hypothetical protein B0H13DRAFT_1873076 [Mycena leptocephala]